MLGLGSAECLTIAVLFRSLQKCDNQLSLCDLVTPAAGALAAGEASHPPSWLRRVPLASASMAMCERTAQIPGLGIFRLNPVRLVWRSIMVVIITVSACGARADNPYGRVHLCLMERP